MSNFVWKDEYNLGIDVIDREHKKLFLILNDIFSLTEKGTADPKTYKDGIAYLKEHALKHFEDEELYMVSTGYEDLETHRRLHQGFREDTLPALEEELVSTGYSVDSVNHFLGVCAGWLIGHTLTEDCAIKGGTKSKWTALLPKEELEEMKKLMLTLVHNMFQIKAQIISESYGGERFGNGIYYRLVYGSKRDKRKWEVILVFEERLLLNTVGKIMGIQSDKLDVTLINASRYTAKQFVWHIMQHFPEAKSFELEEESLLTYEQLQALFEEKEPQVSLLFNTDVGYFSYCIIAPHLLSRKYGTPIWANNAMGQIGKYLKKRQKVATPKILVVDDSMTIRQGMCHLLGNDYEVTTVSSGIAAIRAVSLNRPDLILMDYEMPVCDGQHVLAMLRSDEEFANIPVIFLTSQGDPASVEKVMKLKPDGYMLKYLKPSEIKKRIDEHFNRKGLEMI